jgi:hypothetical protein
MPAGLPEFKSVKTDHLNLIANDLDPFSGLSPAAGKFVISLPTTSPRKTGLQGYTIPTTN